MWAKFPLTFPYVHTFILYVCGVTSCISVGGRCAHVRILPIIPVVVILIFCANKTCWISIRACAYLFRAIFAYSEAVCICALPNTTYSELYDRCTKLHHKWPEEGREICLLYLEPFSVNFDINQAHEIKVWYCAKFCIALVLLTTITVKKLCCFNENKNFLSHSQLHVGKLISRLMIYLRWKGLPRSTQNNWFVYTMDFLW